MTEQAINKLTAEKQNFKGGRPEKIMMPSVYNALISFCKQNNEFAQAVMQSNKTFSDCLAAVASGIAGGAISDLDAYKKAVQFYFPGADIKCTMTIDLIGSAAGNTPPIEMSSMEEPSKKSVFEMSLDDLF